MNSIYPTNLPGFVYYHDPTKLDFKKSSMEYQDRKNHGELEEHKSYSLSNVQSKEPNSTLNQNFEEAKEYEPDYVKLDKKVLRYFGYLFLHDFSYLDIPLKTFYSFALLGHGNIQILEDLWDILNSF